MEFRVVRFVVHDEPIWRFDDLLTIVQDAAGFTRVGDTRVDPCNEGLAVLLAVEPFRDIRVADEAYGKKWRASAVAALKAHVRKQTPNGVLQLYRDPVDGQLRNLAK